MLPALQTVVLRTRDATFSETSRFTYTRRYLLFGAASPASSLSRSQRHSQIGCQARGVTRPGALAGRGRYQAQAVTSPGCYQAGVLPGPGCYQAQVLPSR
jgi:hypothetical protein